MHDEQIEPRVVASSSSSKDIARSLPSRLVNACIQKRTQLPSGRKLQLEGAVAPPWSQSESIPQSAAFLNPFEPSASLLIHPEAMNVQGLSLVSALTVPRRVGTVRPNKCQAPFSQRCAHLVKEPLHNCVAELSLSQGAVGSDA